jgi:hypothetical protein
MPTETAAPPNIGAAPTGGSTPAVTTTSTETPGVATTPTGVDEGAGSTPAKKGPTQFELDGKKFDVDFGDEEESSDAPDEFKFEDLDKFKESDPDFYKSAKKRLSERERFAKKFKTPEELDAYTARIDTLSNGKGLDALENTINAIAEELQGWRQGKPGKWAEEAPEEFSAAAAEFDKAWMKADEKAWVANRAQAFMSALQAKDAGGQSALSALLSAVKQTTDPQVKALLERTLFTIDAINQNSMYKPDSTALATRQVAQREAAVFSREVDQLTAPLVKSALRTALSKYATDRDLQMTADERASYMDDMEKSFYKYAQKNPRFMRDLTKANESKSLDDISDLVKEHRGDLAAEALKDIYRTRLSKLKENLKREASSKTENTTPGASTPKNAVKWTGRLANNGMPEAQFDFQRMRAEGIDIMETRSFFVKGDNKLYAF